MNNSLLSSSPLPPDEPSVPWKEREAKLVRIIDAIKAVAATREWSSLKTEIFDGRLEETRKALFHEARKDHPDLQMLARLNGKYEEVRKFADLQELGKVYQMELQNLRVKYGSKPEKPESGWPTGF